MSRKGIGDPAEPPLVHSESRMSRTQDEWVLKRN